MEESGSRSRYRGRIQLPITAEGFPTWMLLEPIVLRRDDDKSFPDATKAPIRAIGTTSWGAQFRIAFSLAKPPQISRLYAQLPGFPDSSVAEPLSIVATHRHLVLVRVATRTSEMRTIQNFFMFKTRCFDNPCSLELLPPCYAPTSTTFHPDANPRLLDVRSLGLWSKGGEFVVAELRLLQPISHLEILADICMLCSKDVRLGRTWKTEHVKIVSSRNTDIWQIRCWSTDTVIPFHKWLCWIDYQRGILLCDMSKLPNPPAISFVWFPVDKLPPTSTRTVARSFFYRGVSVVLEYHLPTLKFVNVTRDDGIPFGALKPGGSFTITCHTLVLGDDTMAWKEDYKLTSSELWCANPPDLLPRDILIFPQVDIISPCLAHFLFIQFGCITKKMWVVTIDMSTKTVKSCSMFINGEEGLKTDDADLIGYKNLSPKPFLPCEFSQYLSKRNIRDMAAVCLSTSS